MTGHRHLLLAARRDRALRRLRHVRMAITALAVAAAAFFVQAAANAFPGHAATRGVRRAAVAPATSRSRPLPVRRHEVRRAMQRPDRVIRPAAGPPRSATAPTTAAPPPRTTTAAPAPVASGGS